AEFARETSRGGQELFAFSLEPVRVAELLWPNVFGCPLPANHSWLQAVRLGAKPAKLWVHSLYLGALTVPLAAAAVGRPGGRPRRSWMAAVAGLGLLASFGEYAGPVWWARLSPAAAAVIGGHDPPEVAGARNDGKPRDGDGSPYWAMATLLPGFRMFRYPSKL